MSTYNVVSGDGTRERAGIQGIAAARRVAQDLADETGEPAEIYDPAMPPGDEGIPATEIVGPSEDRDPHA